jgi:magnesium transporter
MLRPTEGISAKAGLPPGTPVHVGEKRDEPVELQVIDYNEDEVKEATLRTVEECASYAGTSTVSWINVTGVHDVGLLDELGKAYGLHPLVVEDIANTTQRPKADDYEDLLYVSLKMLSPGQGKVEVEQVSLVLGRNHVLSFQEKAGDVFDPVRIRIREGRGRIRRMGADYLLCCLLDAVVDGYFSVCEFLSERVEPLHDQLLEEPTPETLSEVHALRQETLALRKSVWPLREVANRLERLESPLICDETRLYLRDVYDHTVQIIETIESYRDTIGGLADLYLSSVSNRMNEVMKVLTIIATIFIPLSFVAGVYGMNFANMPELGWQWGYPAALAVMATVAVGMLIYFRRRKWL